MQAECFDDDLDQDLSLSCYVHVALMLTVIM